MSNACNDMFMIQVVELYVDDNLSLYDDANSREPRLGYCIQCC